MSRSLPTPSTARFVLTSITAAAVFYAPTTVFASPSSDSRASLKRYIAIQGGAGAGAGAATGSATTSAGSQAGVLATNARATVARYVEARQSMQALQSAARAAAQAAASSVPNGLGAGGLLVAPGATVGSALWTGAQLPTQQVAGELTTVTVDQNESKALLTWQNFNIGRETKLRFNQGGGDWIAFNQIVDPSANPTRILGAIEAPGQVYIINPNGVIFSGSAQVNTRTLVASSLPLNTSLVARGVTNNPDGQFLFSGLAAPAGAQTNAFTPPAPLAANNRYGDVLVEAGAILNSPTSADKSGGRVALIGPNVTHAGSISTPDGQTILAAGLQVGLEASADASLRGLLPSVGSVGDYAGTVRNTGLIDAPRGAVTVVGKSINQSGVIGSTTSVSRNGRIDLLAQYDAVPVGDFAALPDFFASTTGLVTLGAGSRTEILPETSSSEKALGTALALGSQLNLRGLALHMESDATVLAPAAAVNFDAGRWTHIGLGSAQAKALFVYPEGQIYLESGASINVAGSTGVTASVADNIIEASLKGDELADSPLQRLGSLKGETIRFDVLQTGTFNGVNWVGTPLADVSGYVNNIQRNVGQLTTSGGTVNFTAGDSVVVRSGASIDVSGGYIDYAGAKVETTKVIYQGRYVDIAQATPDLVYEGLYNGVFTPVTNTAKWGEAAATSRQSRNRLFTERFEPGYIQGGDAGALNIKAASVALDGTLTGKSVSGLRQRTTPAQSGGLSLSFQNQVANVDATNGFLAQTPRPPALTFTKVAGAGAPSAFSLDANGLPGGIGTERTDKMVLSPELVSQSGFGRITVDNRDGDVVVAADGGLALPAGGELTLTGKNVIVRADLSAKGGKIALTANGVSHDESNTSDLLSTAPVLGANRGLLQVGAGVKVSTAGVIQNDAVGSAEDPLVTKGGTVTLTGFALDLESGSMLDVSGGVYATSGARLAYGNGGTLSLFSGRDATEPTVLGGYLNLGATLKGFSGAKGGSLVLLAPALHIGGGTAAANATVFEPEFFQTGGFTSFDLRGIGGVANADLDLYTPAVRVSAGTVIAPRASSYFVQADTNATERLGFGVSLLDVGQRSATSLSLSALGSRDGFNLHPIRGDLAVRGDLVVEAGASITTDPAAKITLTGDTVILQGSLVARGGAITMKAGSNSNTLIPSTHEFEPQATLVVDSGARIDASGVTVLQPDSSGRDLRLGKVLAGGTVSLTGNILAEPGAVIDVSGASDTLDLNPVFSGRASRLGGFSTTPTQVDSAGGTLTLSGGQLLITEATLRGASGGASAEGGKLVVSSGIYRSPLDTNAVTPDEVSLIVTQSAPAEDDYDTGRGNFAVDDFTAGGFDSLNLRGVVRFDGPVSISAARDLSVASGGVLYGESAVVLSAARVSLGTDLVKPKLADQDELRAFFASNNDAFDVAPDFGTGRLTVNASQLIDVGNLSLQNFGVAELLAPKGDIRGSGTLDVAGSLSLTAAQIYPPTAAVFSLHAYNYAGGTGSITVSAGASAPALPLSAGGTLNLHANSISQNGVLRAPLGVINLGWNGTGTAPVDLMTGQAVPVASQVSLGAGGVTSVSAFDARTGQAVIVPYGAYANGISWVDPQGRVVSTLGPVAKQVNLSAATVSSAAGAQVDLNGGGDLQVARFETGTGGHTDHLASAGSFALLPSYTAEFAPFAAYNDSTFGQALLGSDTGYVNSTLALGDRIYLDAGAGLAAGAYTLLPARYATLPGAFLVTPKSGSPFASAVVQPDQSVQVSGFRFNASGKSSSATPLRSLFEVAGADVVAKRAFYNTSLGSEFFQASAARNAATVPRLSLDAGQLVFSATQAMDLQGRITALAATGGRGGQVDINSPVDIRIGGAATTALPGELLLDASRLSAFAGASLLVGGKRETTAQGTRIQVATGQITVDNAGAPLSGAEIILAATETVSVGAGEVIRQEGTLGAAGAQDLVIGDKAVAGSGDGALLRVTSDSQAGVTRAGVSTASTASLVIAAGANLDGGAGLTLDTTGTNQIASTAGLRADALALSSGRISLQLDAPGTLAANPGLVLTSGVLDELQVSSNRLALLSYSSIDIYGTGRVGSESFAQLTLRAPSLRGFNNGGGTATFQADSIQLDGGSGGTAPAAVAADSGTLVFDARSLRLDAGQMKVSQFGQVTLSASDRLLMAGQGGLTATGAVVVETPLITAETAAVQQLTAGGRLTLANPTSGVASSPASGLGAKLTFTGGTGVTVDTAIALPSGALALQATTGDLVIGESGAARLDVGGTSLTLLNTLHYTDAGVIRLGAGSGDVRIGSQGILAVSAAAAAGDAGRIEVSAANGRFTSTGSLLGAAGADGLGGRFSDDVGGSLAGTSLAALDQILNAGGFDVSRTHRIRTGAVALDGLAVARSYEVIADTGALTVTGTVDASGKTGGSIKLSSRGDLTVANGARLDASAETFDSAGKGGSIKLAAGSSLAGVANTAASLTLAAGATLDLSVDASNELTDAGLGRATGTLHLRAPRTVAGTDLAVNPLAATIVDASRVTLEGFKVRDLTPGSGTSATITSAVRTSVLAEATTFGNASSAILARVSGTAEAGTVHVLPGVEIVNRTGDLVLDGIWDLSTARFGPATSFVQREPGVLTLRAQGNISLPYVSSASASLSDGFGTGTSALTTTTALWNAPLLAAGSRSWSYNIVAGSDLGSAGLLTVLAADAASPSKGSFLLGSGAPAFATTIDTRQATNGVTQFYQVVRTGTGDIAIAARGDIELRNNLATIYTVGTQAAALADFDVPNASYNTASTDLGARQYATTNGYVAHYSHSGGDVSLFAQNDIFRTVAGLIDSSKQMPTTWLSRRGNVDEATGEFSAYLNSTANGPRTQRNSTSWWVDFNNFFEGVGALGGGHVNVTAGSDVVNIDAVAPTNARMPFGTPDATKLLELGGGDVTVRAGGNIDGGVYYVERGRGTLAAGGDITTNHTRTSLKVADFTTTASTASATWLPTTLFLGKGAFDLSAGGDLTLGNVANPFLLPGGINNSYFLKSYFSTYAADSGVDAFALTGDLTLRSRNPSIDGGSLYDWYNNVLRRNKAIPGSTLAGKNQPWLRLYETDMAEFATVATLMPGRLDAFAATGDVNLVGVFNFLPSAQGGLQVTAADSLNGLQVVGFNRSTQLNQWASAVVNFSDANPALLPSVAAPLSVSFAGISNSALVNTVTRTTADLSLVNAVFAESGSYTGDVYGRIQTKQNLHATHSVHAQATEPVRFIAGSGDISGFTLFSAQKTEVRAGRDISDVALYLQNLATTDVSVVSAGRDLLLYNPASQLRTLAVTAGNSLLATSARGPVPASGNPTAGDLQIGGGGTLSVQAGRDIDFGTTLPADDGISGGLKSPGDGTAVGLTSIGNVRNLNLPDAGADVVIGVGVGDGSRIDRAAFDTAFLNPATAGANATRYLPVLAGLLGLTGADDATVFAAYSNFPSDARAQVTSAMFNQVLRDAGRDHNDSSSAGFGGYDAGFAAIAALFPGADWQGDLRLSSRVLTTSAGGDITVFAPGGGINLGNEITASQTPPGIITERGGDISLFTHNDVDIGTQRIFTLRGGDIMIWSSTGDIAAGSSSTTVQSASPTRVLIDPQTGDVQTDLAGLATGGGIGVLAAVEGVAAGDVDLIAPVGTIDAGDAGIRSVGNISIAALTVLNAANISAGGTTSGTPPAAAPAVAVATATASPDTGASSSAAEVAQAGRGAGQVAKTPSFVNIEVIGYGGGDGDQEKEKTADGV